MVSKVCKTILLFAVFSISLIVSASQIKHTTVKTNAPNNKEVKIFYRVPHGYDPKKPESYRVLVYFGGRNDDPVAMRHVNGKNGWGKWADNHKIFIVCPYFREDEYWNPKVWSGQALLTGLANIKLGYNICTDKILIYGYSAGGRASNLFAAWKPEMIRAWGSHAANQFHRPTAIMRGLPGLVTCGDADPLPYMISRKFLDDCRREKVNIVWKSYYNITHKVNQESITLATQFLLFYHQQYKNDLLGMPTGRSVPVKFVGDDIAERFYPLNSPGAMNVNLKDQVFLPDETVARAWNSRALL